MPLAHDLQMREVCNAFLDAIEARDMERIGQLLSPNLAFWANFTGQTKGREAMLAGIAAGYAVHRHRHYNDRQIRVTDDGFLTQYSCCVTRHDGSVAIFWAAMIARVSDGQITHGDEYMDAGKFAPARAAA